MKKTTLISIIIAILLTLNTCELKSNSNNNTTPQTAVETQDEQIETKHDLKYDYEIFVIGISDGDTFTGLTHTEKIEIRYRIHGIDAPEKAQPFSNKAKQLLSEMIFNKMVGIKVETKRDRYGRPIVRVFTPDGKDVGAELLRQGLAWHYKQYDNSEEYANLENVAKEARIGLWSDNSSIEPWDWRKGVRSEKKEKQ